EKIRVPMGGALNGPRQLEKVLAHEFTHALVKSMAPRGVPTWVDEGLAVVLETGDLKWAERLARQAPSLIPLPRLHDGFLSLPADQLPLGYAERTLGVRMLSERGAALLARCFSYYGRDTTRANRLMQEGNWEAAMAAYQEALKDDPFNPTIQAKLNAAKGRVAAAYQERGRAALKERNLMHAIEAFKQALSLEPSNLEHQSALAQALRYKEA